MGAPLGNQNGAKLRKPWTDALNHALKTYEDDKIEVKQALKAIAKEVVKRALQGDKDAVQEIGNRLDGKPSQVIAGPSEDGSHKLIVEVVRFADQNPK